MKKKEKKLLLEGIQYVGFALTDNMEDELRAILALEQAVIWNDFYPLERLITANDDLETCEDCGFFKSPKTTEINNIIQDILACINPACNGFFKGYGLK